MTAMRTNRTAGHFPTVPAIALGVGLGAFFDGIVLHQLLQWHHFISYWRPVESVETMRLNTLWDGIFHSFTYVVAAAALFFLWRSVRSGARLTGRRMVGAILIGWGGFNLYDGVINHLMLEIHHVNETVDRALWPIYDVGFILWGAVMLLAGLALWLRAPGSRWAAGVSRH